MVADRVFWYRRILAMAVIALSMAFLCTKLINERQDDVVLTGNSGTLIYPCGFPVGIYLETEGVLVIGTDTITGVDGLNYEPAYDLIREVDYIAALNGETVGLKGVKLTGVFAGAFSLLSLVFFILYNDKKVAKEIEEYKKKD